LARDQTVPDTSPMEFVVREVGNDIYVLACKKEGPTIHVRFGGLPVQCPKGQVLFEEPREVEVKDAASPIG